MSYPELSVLIPAAGTSQRLGQAKQLVMHKGNPLIQNMVNAAHSLQPREIIVVTGANAEAVKNAVLQPPVRWIHNSDWPNGMGGSIALGAAAISPESIGLMILLSDQWQIQSRDLHALAAAWWSNPALIVCAQANGINMPPAIFPSSCFNALGQLKGNTGARSLFDKHPHLLQSVPIENAAIDLDTQTQLGNL